MCNGRARWPTPTKGQLVTCLGQLAGAMLKSNCRIWILEKNRLRLLDLVSRESFKRQCDLHFFVEVSVMGEFNLQGQQANSFFALEERDVYSHERSSKDLAPLGAKHDSGTLAADKSD
jgi:hypothetical protein